MAEWRLEVDDQMVHDLASEFARGPLLDDGRHLLEEQLVEWLDGLRIEILSREHPPPHFCVTYQGKSNNFDICTGEPLEGNALRKWHRTIRGWHASNRDKLIRIWNERRPTDCPVGEVNC